MAGGSRIRLSYPWFRCLGPSARRPHVCASVALARRRSPGLFVCAWPSVSSGEWWRRPAKALSSPGDGVRILWRGRRRGGRGRHAQLLACGLSPRSLPPPPRCSPARGPFWRSPGGARGNSPFPALGRARAGGGGGGGVGGGLGRGTPGIMCPAALPGLVPAGVGASRRGGLGGVRAAWA